MGERGEKLVNFNIFLISGFIKTWWSQSFTPTAILLLLCAPATHALCLVLSCITQSVQSPHYLSSPSLTQHLSKFQLLFHLDDLSSSVSLEWWQQSFQNMDSGLQPCCPENAEELTSFSLVSSSAFSPCSAVVPFLCMVVGSALEFLLMRVTHGLLWGCQGQALYLQTEPSRKKHCLPSLQLPLDLPTA